MAVPVAALIPQTYEQWADCIERACGIPLTPEFVRARIEALTRAGGEEAERFALLYGPGHRERVIAWYRQALVRSGAATTGARR